MSERDELTWVSAGLTGILPRDGGHPLVPATERIRAGEVVFRPAGMPDQGPAPGPAADPAALPGPGGAGRPGGRLLRTAATAALAPVRAGPGQGIGGIVGRHAHGR